MHERMKPRKVTWLPVSSLHNRDLHMSVSHYTLKSCHIFDSFKPNCYNINSDLAQNPQQSCVRSSGLPCQSGALLPLEAVYRVTTLFSDAATKTAKLFGRCLMRQLHNSRLLGDNTEQLATLCGWCQTQFRTLEELQNERRRESLQLHPLKPTHIHLCTRSIIY
jgi:hypothetical protein